MLETELFAFLERTSDAAFVVTEQGEIRSWNKSAEELFGYSACEVANRDCHEVLVAGGYWGRRFAGVAAAFKLARRSRLRFPTSTSK